jgi:hypothetical protein
MNPGEPASSAPWCSSWPPDGLGVRGEGHFRRCWSHHWRGKSRLAANAWSRRAYRCVRRTFARCGRNAGLESQMDELAYGSSARTHTIGLSRIPRHRAACQKGHRSGSASAVAGGLVNFFALGHDTACSVRLPAARCDASQDLGCTHCTAPNNAAKSRASWHGVPWCAAWITELCESIA